MAAIKSTRVKSDVSLGLVTGRGTIVVTRLGLGPERLGLIIVLTWIYVNSQSVALRVTRRPGLDLALWLVMIVTCVRDVRRGAG
jgi:hypothetical protein